MSWGISASHVPVLTLLPNLFSIKRVLEIGSGELSTLLFLDKNIYPDLTDLVSVEEDPKWWDTMVKKVGKDDRVTFLPKVPANLFGYDLIFVDGPQSGLRRAKTIKFVMWQPDGTLLNSLIVVHDIEVRTYRKQINKNYNKYIFTFCKSPMTGLFKSDQLPIKTLPKMNRLMYKNFKDIEENWDTWKKILK